MLLVCPKCVAQYEVDDQAIPEGGREVQCASCDHIWFQDQLKMLSGKPGGEDEPVAASDDTPQEDEIFQDLDGVKDVEFRTAREDNDGSVSFNVDADEEPIENILGEEFDDSDEDDLSMEIPEGGLKVDQKVLDVLRSEAAFSSARNKEDSPQPPEQDAEAEEDDLAAFLNAHLDDEPDEIEEPDQEPEITESPPEYGKNLEDVAPAFDPLSDLDAIRSQLDDIGNDLQEEAEIVYEPMLPEEDGNQGAEPSATIQDDDIAAIITSLDQEEPAPEGIERDSAELQGDEQASVFDDDIEEVLEFEDDVDAEPEIDEFDEYTPRKAFRADGADAGFDEDIVGFDDPEDSGDVAPDTANEPAFFEDGSQDDESLDEISAIPAAAALGALRPRANGGSVRVRNIKGTEDIAPPQLDAAETAAAAQPLTRPTRAGSSGRTARPGADESAGDTNTPETKVVSRKELLPDVEELNSTLREQAVAETQATGEVKPASNSNSFIRSLAVTLLILALLIGLYAMKPAIVATIPAAAVVLDPYVSFIDSLRLMIEGALG